MTEAMRRFELCDALGRSIDASADEALVFAVLNELWFRQRNREATEAALALLPPHIAMLADGERCNTRDCKRLREPNERKCRECGELTMARFRIEVASAIVPEGEWTPKSLAGKWLASATDEELSAEELDKRKSFDDGSYACYHPNGARWMAIAADGETDSW